MFDGKKWRTIPIVTIATRPGRDDRSAGLEFAQDDGTPEEDEENDADFIDAHDGNNYGADEIKARVEAYREAVLSDLDNMGFVVRYERGRYTVAPALKSREELESRYYFGPADKRRIGLVTVHRDNFGVQIEVEKLEVLINSPDVSERELQAFFEVHPHFLSITHTVLPQVRLARHDGGLLIPDFILKPIAAKLISCTTRSKRRNILFSTQQELLFESTQAHAGGRGGAVRPLSVDRMEVPDRVAVSGGVCGHTGARAATEVDALCVGVVLDCAAAEPL